MVAKKWSPSIVVIMSPLHGEGRMFDPCGDQLLFLLPFVKNFLLNGRPKCLTIIRMIESIEFVHEIMDD